MGTEPTPSDFRDWLAFHLDQAIQDAARSVRALDHRASASGRSSGSVLAVVEATKAAFNSGADTAFSELTALIERSSLDRTELRAITEEQLRRYHADLKKVSRFARFASLMGNKFVQDTEADFDRRLAFALRQYDAGFLRPKGATSLSLGNSIHIGTNYGGAIQQGNANSTQHSEVSFRASEVAAAIGQLEAALASVALPDAEMNNLKADIATIKAQLAKPEPTRGVLREAGASLKNVLEGAISGAAGGPLASAAAQLWKALGLS